MINVQKAIMEIKDQTSELAPVYLIVGVEKYLMDTFKRSIQQTLLSQEELEFNLATVNLLETPLSEAIEEARTVPFFGDRRLIFVENPYFLTSEKKNNDLEHNINELLEYLKFPSLSSTMVFFAPYEKLDERKKIVKTLKKSAVVINAAPLKEPELRKYLQDYIKNAGYTITPEAFETLIQLTNANLLQAISEINKLMIYSSDTKKIIKSSVEELVPKSLEHNIFAMTDEILAKNTKNAMELYHDLLLQGEETIKINSILISQIRLLLQTKILSTIGYQQGNIVETLKVHPFRVKLAIKQVRRYSADFLGNLFDVLVENDYKMKSGQMDKKYLFEIFLLKATK